MTHLEIITKRLSDLLEYKKRIESSPNWQKQKESCRNLYALKSVFLINSKLYEILVGEPYPDKWI